MIYDTPIFKFTSRILLCLVVQSYPTLCSPMDCRPPGSSVHGIFQARVPEWVTIFWASLIAQLVKNLLQCRRPQFYSHVRKIPWRRDRLPTPVFLSFPCGSAGKESTCNTGDLGSISSLRRCPGEWFLLQSNRIKSLKIMINNI